MLWLVRIVCYSKHDAIVERHLYVLGSEHYEGSLPDARSHHVPGLHRLWAGSPRVEHFRQVLR